MSQPLLIVLLCFHASLACAAAIGGRSHSPSHRLQLLREPAPPGPARLEHLREIFRNDQLRQRLIRERIARHSHGRRTCDVSRGANHSSPAMAESFKMPLRSGAYTGTGQYFARFLVGTPAQRFLLVADTGSDLTWFNCRRGGGGGGGGNGTRTFLPGASSSFRPIPCSSDMCKLSLPFSLTTCPTPASPCAYEYGYSDGSTAEGVYANESATIIQSNGHRAKLRGLVVGCTSSAVGSSFRSSDGVLGLGNSAISFATRAAARFGGRFSYCLVDHLSPRSASSFLTFGHNPSIPTARAPRETALILDIEPFYAVGVVGISVDGETLPIPASVWDVGAGGGAILDSGTTLTVLAEPAYRAVATALSGRLAGVPRISADPFEYCYNWTAVTSGSVRVKLPRMAVHLEGEARLQPPAKSYVIDVSDGVKCLGIMAAPWPGLSTVGNILQQEHLWEFDLRNRRLRFTRSTCRGGR